MGGRGEEERDGSLTRPVLKRPLGAVKSDNQRSGFLELPCRGAGSGVLEGLGPKYAI